MGKIGDVYARDEYGGRYKVGEIVESPWTVENAGTFILPFFLIFAVILLPAFLLAILLSGLLDRYPKAKTALALFGIAALSSLLAGTAFRIIYPLYGYDTDILSSTNNSWLHYVIVHFPSIFSSFTRDLFGDLFMSGGWPAVDIYSGITVLTALFVGIIIACIYGSHVGWSWQRTRRPSMVIIGGIISLWLVGLVLHH